MAQEKDERSNATAKKIGETAEDSAKRPSGTTGTTGRPTHRESGNGNGSNGATVSATPATRRERYLIGTRAVAGLQAFGNSRQSMDELVDYLGRQEHVEIVKRLKLGGDQPFAADAGGLHEVIVAKIEAGGVQRLRAVASDQLIDRKSVV